MASTPKNKVDTISSLKESYLEARNRFLVLDTISDSDDDSAVTSTGMDGKVKESLARLNTIIEGIPRNMAYEAKRQAAELMNSVNGDVTALHSQVKGIEEKFKLMNSGFEEKFQLMNRGFEEKFQLMNSGFEEKFQLMSSGMGDIKGLVAVLMKRGISVDLCDHPQGTETLPDRRRRRDRSTTNFETSHCEWGDKSLLMSLHDPFSESCNVYAQFQGHNMCEPPLPRCFIVSRFYNNSADPTRVFKNCARVIWIPLKSSRLFSANLSPWNGPSVSIQYAFVEPPGQGNAMKEMSSNSAVIALAVLFAMAIISIIFLLIIAARKEKLSKLWMRWKISRGHDLQVNTENGAAAADGVYAEPVDPSIYHEVGPDNEKEIVQNKLYGMN